MPKLELGRAIAKGAESFVNSFQQGKMLEQQEKLQKNQIIAQAMQIALQDENVPYSQRFKILDSIPNLYGVKLDRPLSEQYGLHELLDKDIETEQEQTNVQTSSANAKVEGREEGVSAETTSNPYNLITKTPAKTQKFGDLSPAQYKSLIIRRQKQLDDADELQHQTKLLQIQQELQDKSYASRGWEKQGDWFLDEKNKEWVQVYFNPHTNQSREQRIKDVIPQRVVEAEMRGNRPSNFVREREDYWETQINPATGRVYTTEEASQLALKDANERFKADLTYKTGQATRTTQSTTGSVPVTEAQRRDDERADETNRISRENNLIQLRRQQQEAEAAEGSLSDLITEQESNVVQRQKEFDTIKEDYEPEEQEYQRAEDALNREQGRLRQLKNQQGNTRAKAKAAKSAADEYQSTINNSRVDTRLTPDIDISNITDSMIRQSSIFISAFKKKYPKAGLSDKEIVLEGIKQGKIKFKGK